MKETIPVYIWVSVKKIFQNSLTSASAIRTPDHRLEAVTFELLDYQCHKNSPVKRPFPSFLSCSSDLPNTVSGTSREPGSSHLPLRTNRKTHTQTNVILINSRILNIGNYLWSIWAMFFLTKHTYDPNVTVTFSLIAVRYAFPSMTYSYVSYVCNIV